MRRAAIALCLALGAVPVAHGASPARGPNIIYVLADDLGYAELGCYGQERIRTPRIDRLAAQGMRLTQHYAGAPVCAPSRCVLMTGKHLGHAHVRDNREVRPEGQQPIPGEETTVAEVLKGAGYATAAIGKWGLGPPGSSGDPLRQGFDLFFGYNCQRHAHSYYPSYLWHNDRRVPLENDPPVPGHASLPEGADPDDPKSYESYQGTDHAADRMVEMALRFIRESREEPFFLYFPSPLPHLALHIGEEDIAPYRGRWPETPFTGGRGYTPHRTPRAAYAAMITRLDRDVGRIVDLVDELGLGDRTLVLFSSDNGTTHLDREVDAKFFESVGPLRGLKGSVYEGGIRVPMIARWTGTIRPGTVSDHVSAFHDVLPTLAEVAGVEPPAGIDGISFLPTLQRRPDRQRDHEFLLWEFHGYGGQQAVRMGRWKGVRTGVRRQPGCPIQLYDLDADPGESRDVAAGHPDIVDRIRKVLIEEHTDSELFALPGLEPPGPSSPR